jgi:hypothetical protein
MRLAQAATTTYFGAARAFNSRKMSPIIVLMFRSGYLVLVLICASAAGTAGRAFPIHSDQGPKLSAVKLSDAEAALVASSRKAIISTGVSDKYFERHFTLLKVVNQPGDRRVLWKFSVNGYQTTVSDVLGYYTQDGKRVDTHSVASTLRQTTEIEKTISRSAANRVMRKCIGTFANPAFELIANGNEARLIMTAEAVTRTARRREKEEREREERERAPSQNKQGTDVIENEGNNGPPIIFGSVDLQSGKCTKGRLMTTP